MLQNFNLTFQFLSIKLKHIDSLKVSFNLKLIKLDSL